MLRTLLVIIISGCIHRLYGQSEMETRIQEITSQIGTVTGNMQFDAQTYQYDSIIGTPKVPEKARSNMFTNILWYKGHFSAGFRYEHYLNPLLGFDPRYTGSGIPYRFAKFTSDFLEVTIGNVYEQFGSGLILRTFDDRSLGYDNSVDGFGVQIRPVSGVTVKGIWGRQRSFFTLGQGIVRGVDGEVSLNELLDTSGTWKTQISVGGGFVSKYQPDQDPVYRLPENVGTWAARLNFKVGKVNLFAEYAHKVNDPSAVNSFIYKNGEALLLTLSYARKNLGFSLNAKRLDNMDFRSDRTASGNNLNINFMPPIAKQHTYRLNTLYLYATQPLGEMGLQGDLYLNLPKETSLGGKYGTNITMNFSIVQNIDTTQLSNGLGYESKFFSIGKRMFYRDFNIEINRKISSKLKLTAAYFNIVYDKDKIQGLSGVGTVYANMWVLEALFKINAKHSIRMEAQQLLTKQDMGNWMMGLLEYTISPHWFLAVFDEYNYGNKEKMQRIHYLSSQIGYQRGNSRLTVGYARQRAGLVCVGGLCRVVPASNGFQVSVTTSF
ncbi:MAG: DUF6029 family protein [Bacteroidia bacterium]|nr:DUF6029 family protein [Bacteroidia bacterium]